MLYKNKGAMCVLLLGLNVACSHAMDDDAAGPADENQFQLSPCFNRLVDAMRPILDQKACVPEAQADACSAVRDLRWILNNPRIGMYIVADINDGIDRSIERAFEERNYEHIVCCYDTILKKHIAPAWGLITPADRETLDQENKKIEKEWHRIYGPEHPSAPIQAENLFQKVFLTGFGIAFVGIFFAALRG